eukprot:2930561-Prymnesium_polylepis.1
MLVGKGAWGRAHRRGSLMDQGWAGVGAARSAAFDVPIQRTFDRVGADRAGLLALSSFDIRYLAPLHRTEYNLRVTTSDQLKIDNLSSGGRMHAKTAN